MAKKDGEFVQSQLSRVMNTDLVNRAVVQAWQERGMNRKTIVFAVDVAHAHALAREFNDAGYPTGVVDGTMKDRERTKVLKAFYKKELKLLCSCEVLTEGYDDPSIEAVLMARPTQSQGLWIQMVGRGLRLFPSKTECLLIDCVGNTERHNLSQLASIAGLDPEEELKKKERDLDDMPEDSDDPEVLHADVRAEDIDLYKQRTDKSRYPWRETKTGWFLQIPKVGYYLVAWHGTTQAKCVVRFYDQRPGRHNDAAKIIIEDPIAFEMAYGLVEAELDRIMMARGGAKKKSGRYDNYEAPQALPEINWVDLDEGIDEDTHVPEALMYKDSPWRARATTEKQMKLLRKYGVKEGSIPATAGESSDLISILRVERDAKMRMPITQKQLAYLQLNGLPITENMTKGQAAALIWPHRKRMMEG